MLGGDYGDAPPLVEDVPVPSRSPGAVGGEEPLRRSLGRLFLGKSDGALSYDRWDFHSRVTSGLQIDAFVSGVFCAVYVTCAACAVCAVVRAVIRLDNSDDALSYVRRAELHSQVTSEMQIPFYARYVQHARLSALVSRMVLSHVMSEKPFER